MPVFMVEFFLPRSRAKDTTELSARVSQAADELVCEGTSVRIVQALAFPEDELFQCLVEAGSAEVVIDLQRRAGLSTAVQPELVDLLPLPQPQHGGETPCTSQPG